MDQNRPTAPPPTPAAPPWWIGALLVAAAPVILAIGFSTGRQLFGPATASPGEKIEPATEIPDSLFKGWGQPDIALLLSGQTFGYLQPCGCSSPQYGGLVRRYNVVKLLEKKGWKIAGVDLGEIYPPKADLPDQALEKWKTTLRSLDQMNYQDFGLGLPELKVPLLSLLPQIGPLNIKKPRPVSLDLKDPNKLFQALSVRSFDVISEPGKKVSVGVSSMVGPSVAAEMAGAANIEFFDNAPMVQALLPALLKNKVDIAVLLVHGTEPEAINIAKLCKAERVKNPALPSIDLIVHTSDFDTPPARPQLAKGTDTRLLFMGHKGKDVGVLGVFRKPGGGFEMKYELVSLGPNFDTPKGQDKDHPVMKLMQDYSQTVKDRDFLEAYRALRVDHPTQRDAVLKKDMVEAKFVGTETCGNCHAAALKVWQATGHSHAFQTLVDDKNPTLRQFDPECVMCHTVGFKYRTGFYDPPVGANANQAKKHNEKLFNVGCESCHGPGSMHANDPNNKAYLPLINPIKLNNPNGPVLLDRFCQSCHDIENDVHWGQKKPFAQSWEKIAHPEPKKVKGE